MPKRWLSLAVCLLTSEIFAFSSGADSAHSQGTTLFSTNAESASPRPALPDKNSTPDPIATLEAGIIAAKTCDQVELSPDEQWLALTRNYSVPARGHIWQDSDGHSCLLIREVYDRDGTGIDLELGPDFFYWEIPASYVIIKIAWSLDSRFLLMMLSSAGGHQPWAFPVLVLDMKDNKLRSTDPLGTVVSDDFKFTDPEVVTLKTGEPSSPQSVSFDLGRHIGDLPIVAELKRDSLER